MQSYIYIFNLYVGVLEENFKILAMILVRLSRLRVLKTRRPYHVASS